MFTANTGAFSRRLRRFIDHGSLLDINVLKEFLRTYVGDMTFEEAHAKTSRVLNIVCTRYMEHPKGTKSFWAMNYLTAPHVTIWSAACASCAVPGIYEQVDLVAKNCHGELEPYMPATLKWGNCESPAASERHAWQRLSELFNINYIILSETNISMLPSFSIPCFPWYERVFNTV